MSSLELFFAVVICHGSYHTPEPFQPFLAALKRQGIEGYCPQLPTSDLSKLNVGDISNPDYDRDPPPNGYPQPAEDVEVVDDLLSKLIKKENKYVVLIGHPAGGFTATAAAIPNLQAKSRRAKGEKGGIVGVFYEGGFLIPMGESVHSFVQPKDGSPPVIPPYCEFHVHWPTMEPTDERPTNAYTIKEKRLQRLAIDQGGCKILLQRSRRQDCERYEATLTASQVPPAVLENDAYTALPCAYLVTENDIALPASYQEGMIAMQSSRPGVNMTTYKCPAGHSPHLSWTEGFVMRVREFAQKAVV